MLSTAVRAVCLVLWLCNRKLRRPIHISPSESDTWDDDEIIRRTESSPYLPGSNERLVQISDDTVVKFGNTFASSEPLSMDLVRTQTDIPVPHVRRVIDYLHGEGDILIVMNFIPNAKQLHACITSGNCLAFNIHAPPRLDHPVCYGLQFGYDPQGPFTDTEVLAGYFHGLHRSFEHHSRKGYTPSPPPPPLDETFFSHLVFTHNDLNMRNILLDSEDRLWVVDWGFAGFFPPCFEYLAMRYAAQKDKEPEGWQAAIKFMAEPSFEMQRWMGAIGYDYTC